jgi:nicotinamidase-related amidase
MVAPKKIVAPSLLDAKNHAVVLVDPQYMMLLSVRSHLTTSVVDGLALLAKGAKLFGVNTLITVASAARRGLLREVQDALPDESVVERAALNPFEDERVVAWADRAGKAKLVMAGFWTETCVAMAALSALSAGYEVYLVTDACGGATSESHEMAIQRMIQTGAIPISAGGYILELQRDWTRHETARQALALFEQHGGAYGKQLVWDRERPPSCDPVPR